MAQLGWFVSTPVVSHYPAGQQEFVHMSVIRDPRVVQEYAIRLETHAQDFHSVTSATLYWPKQVTGLVQIQRLGKVTPAVDERSCKIHIAKWYGFGAVMENSCDYFYNSPKFAWIVCLHRGLVNFIFLLRVNTMCEELVPKRKNERER